MTNATSKQVCAVEVDGAIYALSAPNGALRLSVEGIDLGPVRGRKRLSGPDLGSKSTTKAIYGQLVATAEYRNYIAACAA